jgi:hypothetical protein
MMRNVKGKRLLFFLNLFFISTFGHSVALLRGPYLQSVSSTSIIIRWRTDSLCASVVQVGISATTGMTTWQESIPKTEHSMTVAGLQPNTKYYYQIGTIGSNFTTGPDYYFRTAPLADSNWEQPIRFWAVGDLSKQTIQQVQVRDRYLARKGTSYVNGWIMLGDNAYENGFDMDYQNGFFNYYQSSVLLNTPLLPVIGNHDYANNALRRMDHAVSYFSIFDLPENGSCGGVPSGTERYYSIDYGNVHCIQLDSYGWEEVNGIYYGLADTLFSPQVTWLKADLEANRLPWTIVSFHHPPYCMGTHNSDLELDLADLRTRLIPILERYNVDLVLNGHSHSYERTNFIKNHVGMETTFNSSTHIRQSGNGHYDNSPNSCAYIKRNLRHYADSGTVYAVVGSGSAIPQLPFSAWPHDAMSYSNYADNGSMLITIEGRKLTAEWISTDSSASVTDRFVLFKNVGKKYSFQAQNGDLIQLRASWPASSYLWNTGDTQRSISLVASQSQQFTVSDLHQCITDTFQINWTSEVEDHANQAWEVFPNPVGNTLYWRGEGSKRIVGFRILNMNGRVMMESELGGSLRYQAITIPSYWTSGLYLVEWTVENHAKYRAKFLLQKE